MITGLLEEIKMGGGMQNAAQIGKIEGIIACEKYHKNESFFAVAKNTLSNINIVHM